VYDEASGHFRYTNAGHNPPLIYRAESGAVDTLRGGSLGLGILPETRYFDRTDLLHPNDLLVLYTDGLTEARSPEGEMFGAERLTQALIECRTMSAPQTLDALIARVGAWRQSTDFVDDLTLVVARKD
jgi:serine phosphatase RsbU (regulator of sigma subunit)